MDIEAMREALQSKLEELEERVSRIDNDLHHREEPMSADFAEQVVEQENLDVLHSLEDEGRAELALVRRALGRLEAGTYGECQKCGEMINEARLQALPWAENCIRCAQ